MTIPAYYNGALVQLLDTASTITEAQLSLSDNTTDDVTSTKHGFAPKSAADATKFLNSAATPAYAQVKDSDLSTSNVTTNNVTTAKHGFAPILPNDATKFFDGTGAYSTPSGSGITHVPVTFSRRNGADYALNNNSSFAAVDATNLNLTIAAATGDVLEISLAARSGNEAVNAFLDAATIVSAAAVNYVSGGTGLSTNFGVGGWLLLSGVAQAFGGSTFYAVQAGDVSGGNVVVRLMYRTSAASNKTLRAGTSSAEALFFAVKNLLH